LTFIIGGLDVGKFVVVTHPLVQSKITLLRDVNTCNKEFRELVEEIAALICYDATRDVPLKEIEIETPICKTKGPVVNREFALIPILRAGIGMVNGMLNLIPTAKVGHLGMYRDPETLQPVKYYGKLPENLSERENLLIDPMMATGGTASAAIDYLKKEGAINIKLVCLITCPEGVEKIQTNHPDVDIYTAAHDSGLNDHGYIVPGLGDAGDRLFGTK